jgi:hypothetical protein
MGRKFSFTSPLGIAITVAGLVLALSPQARSAVRRLMVKGTATAMDAMEQVGGLTAGILNKTSFTPVGDGQPRSTEAESEVEPIVEPDAGPTSTSEQTPNPDGGKEGDTV